MRTREINHMKFKEIDINDRLVAYVENVHWDRQLITFVYQAKNGEVHELTCLLDPEEVINPTKTNLHTLYISRKKGLERS